MSFQIDSGADQPTWDRFVSSSQSGNLMQSYAWGEFQRILGWEPRYGVLRDGSEIRGASLLLTRSVPALGAKVFYAPRGPVADFTDPSATEALFRALGEYVEKEKGVFLRCDPYWTEAEAFEGAHMSSLLSRVPRDWSYWNLPRFVLWLDLSGDEGAVMARMTSRCRNDVRRGYKNDVVFTLGTEAELGDFHRLMSLTGRHKEIAFHDQEYYERLVQVVNASAKVQLFIGRHDGEVITAGMSAAYGDKAWLLYAASAPSSFKLRANRTLQWEMIKWAHAQGCRRYDFRGTATNDPPSPDDPGYGVYQFKKSFGPEFIRLAGYYDLVNRPLLYRALRSAEEYGLPVAYRVRNWLQR